MLNLFTPLLLRKLLLLLSVGFLLLPLIYLSLHLRILLPLVLSELLLPLFLLPLQTLDEVVA